MERIWEEQWVNEGCAWERAFQVEGPASVGARWLVGGIVRRPVGEGEAE